MLDQQLFYPHLHIHKSLLLMRLSLLSARPSMLLRKHLIGHHADLYVRVIAILFYIFVSCAVDVGFAGHFLQG
jgi:hypothetical protein